MTETGHVRHDSILDSCVLVSGLLVVIGLHLLTPFP